MVYISRTMRFCVLQLIEQFELFDHSKFNNIGDLSNDTEIA